MLDSNKLNDLSPIARSTFCLNFIKINQPHIIFWAEEFNIETHPFIKLSAKLQAYLIGDLQSVSNLHRFYEEFCLWREALQDHDCLAYRIVNLCFSTVCAAIDSMEDPDNDDVTLVISGAEQIIEEMADLGCDINEYRNQLIEFLDFNLTLLKDLKQRPVARNHIIELAADSSTLFGL